MRSGRKHSPLRLLLCWTGALSDMLYVCRWAMITAGPVLHDEWEAAPGAAAGAAALEGWRGQSLQTGPRWRARVVSLALSACCKLSFRMVGRAPPPPLQAPLLAVRWWLFDVPLERFEDISPAINQGPPKFGKCQRGKPKRCANCPRHHCRAALFIRSMRRAA